MAVEEGTGGVEVGGRGGGGWLTVEEGTVGWVEGTVGVGGRGGRGVFWIIVSELTANISCRPAWASRWPCSITTAGHFQTSLISHMIVYEVPYYQIE